MILKLLAPGALQNKYWHEMLIECDRFEIRCQTEWKESYYGANDWVFFGTEEPSHDGKPYFEVITWQSGKEMNFVAFNTDVYVMNDDGKTVDKYIKD